MEVKVIPLGGCMQVFLGVMTLGVAPLAIYLQMRSWPSLVDEQGLVTRGGKRIAWQEFTKITRVRTQVSSGGSGVEHFELKYAKGKVDVVVYRLVDGQQVLDYVSAHLPPSAFQQK
jgi:hypothetical protein